MQSLDDIRELMERETGMDFSGNREARLRDAIRKVLSKNTDAVRFAELTSEARSLFLEKLTRELTVGESFFFRNEFHFRALREHIVADILRENSGRREIRIWSAGCATGEEPYSLAILLDQSLESDSIPRPPWAISILGTDLNPEFLQRARDAVYRPWSFRQTDIHLDRRYFSQEADAFRLAPRLREHVHFAYLNLVKDVYPSPLTGTVGMDLILFRNVAIYLRADVTAAIIERFHRALRPGGWLLLGETELCAARTQGYEVLQFEQAAFLRKSMQQGAYAAGLGFEEVSPILPPVPLRSGKSLPNVPTLPEWVPLPKRRDGDATQRDSGLLPQRVAQPANSSDAMLSTDAIADHIPTAWQEIEGCLISRNWADAERMIDRIKDRKEGAATRLRYVQALLCSAEIRRAHEMLDICLKEQPLLIEAQLLQASILEDVGDVAAAEQAYRRALYIDRHCPMAHFHLALVQQHRGDSNGATRSLRTLLRLIEAKHPGSLVEYGEGVCYGRLREMATVLMDSDSSLSGSLA